MCERCGTEYKYILDHDEAACDGALALREHDELVALRLIHAAREEGKDLVEQLSLIHI